MRQWSAEVSGKSTCSEEEDGDGQWPTAVRVDSPGLFTIAAVHIRWRLLVLGLHPEWIDSIRSQTILHEVHAV
jgi:hypothetical protein